MQIEDLHEYLLEANDGVNVMAIQAISKFILDPDGAFVARGANASIEQNGTPRLSATTGEILLAQHAMVDPAQPGAPDGSLSLIFP
ncbi:hypothetical protein LJ656_26190 [Paraburkholderia sp. MMS20-SJTR3]|uniref:Uncharacterized protein n=1 Tax=Paraburkholderia sejongensis TaxID=2886946 RepID=A0ABS8K1P5_9BURK|nr:hypothetical protein [Paraburkholderia sp. MMS20-SJTR3]